MPHIRSLTNSRIISEEDCIPKSGEPLYGASEPSDVHTTNRVTSCGQIG
jgi:hypothetical protein